MKTKLSNEEKRIRLAEWAGIKITADEDSGLWSAIGPGWCSYRTGTSLEHAQCVSLPRYFESLDAVHELIAKLDGTQYAKFAMMLARNHPTFTLKVLDPRDAWEDGFWQMSDLINATAAQRAEAIGITTNLWEAES